MNISLTPELENYIRQKVASGLYNNASEVVREALRLLLGREGNSVGKRREPDPAQRDDTIAALEALEKPLRERGVSSLALFGSVARGAARSTSDVDILIEISPRARFSLIDLVSLKDFLEDRLGRRVDVVLKDALDPTIRDAALRDAVPVF